MKYLKNIKPFEINKVNDFVSHTGRKISSKAIIDNEHTEIRFFSFAEGEDIDKEYYEKETIFWVMEGSLKVLYNEEDEIIVNEGEMVCLESDINYGVKALSTCKVCNILVKA